MAFSAAAKKQLAELDAGGFGRLPVCIAKTQYSFSDDASLLAAPSGFTMTVREPVSYTHLLAVMKMTGVPMGRRYSSSS